MDDDVEATMEDVTEVRADPEDEAAEVQQEAWDVAAALAKPEAMTRKKGGKGSVSWKDEEEAEKEQEERIGVQKIFTAQG